MVSIRFLTCILCMGVGMVTFLTRSNINVAIVSMIAAPNTNDTELDLCPDLDSGGGAVNGTDVEEYHGEVFDWSPGLQGSVQGCFFWTYCLCQGPSGYINGRYGGRIPVSAALLISSVITALNPVFAHVSVYLLIVSRMVMGIFQAAIFPGIFVMAVGWVPVQERALAMAMNESGAMVGTILLFFASGFLVEQYTWTSMFYFPAISALIASIVFFLFTRNKPEDHPLISEKEIAFIRGKPEEVTPSNLEMNGNDTASKTSDSDDISLSSYQEDHKLVVQYAVPWKKMLTNKAVLSLFLFKISRTLIFHLINSKIPFYLKHVLKEDIVSVGIIYAVFTGIMLASVFASVKMSEIMIVRCWMTRTNCRKFFSIFSGTGGAIAFMAMAALRCNRAWIKVFFYFIAICNGLGMASDVAVPPEMTTNFSAILYALCNMCHVIPGFISPMFAGFVLGSVEDEWVAWDIIFNTLGSFCILANIIFLVFMKAERQDFDDVKDPPRRDQRIMSIVSNISNFDPY